MAGSVLEVSLPDNRERWHALLVPLSCSRRSGTGWCFVLRLFGSACPFSALGKRCLSHAVEHEGRMESLSRASRSLLPEALNALRLAGRRRRGDHRVVYLRLDDRGRP